MRKAVFGENSAPITSSGVKEVKGDSPKGIGAKRRPLTSEGRQPLVWFCQWVRFVSTQAAREGVESWIPVKRKACICHWNL
jgi:hypothetical protein